MGIYTISTLDPAPALSQVHQQFSGTYQEAVKAAQSEWLRIRRTVTLSVGTYVYHRIADGIAIDRNLNSGIPHEQRIA